MELEKLPYWKSIWLTCSGHQTSARDAVQKDLNEWSDFFLIGLHQFKPYSADDLAKLQNKLNVNEKLWTFLKRLCLFLNVSPKLGWSIITEYLCDFHGTPTTLQNLTQTKDTSTKLLRDIWHFYTAERMFYIKTLKFILEFHTNESHPYYKEFSAFVKDHLNTRVLRESLVSQLKLLISIKINVSDDMNVEMQNLWIRRNLQEQLEILHCIILTHNMNPIKPDEFVGLLELFSCHRFGSQPIYLNEVAMIPKQLQTKITLCETALLVSVLDSTVILENIKLWESSSKDIDHWITRLTNEIGNELSPVILSWMLIRYNYRFQPSPDFLNLIQNAIDKLYTIVSCPVFKDKTQTSIIIRQSIYNLLQLINSRECDIANERTFFKCFTEVLKDAETANTYWKIQEEDESLITKEKWSFPYDFINYSLVTTGLASAGDKSLKKVLDELPKLPVICLPHANEILTHIASKNNILYFYTDFYPLKDIKIPAGTVCIIESLDNPKTIHVQYEINYWVVLSNVINVSINSIRDGIPPPNEELLVGLQCWLTILNNLDSDIKLTGSGLKDILSPIDPTFELFSEMMLKRITNTDIFALGLEIMSVVYKITNNREICERLGHLNLFPVLVDSYLPLNQLIKHTNFIPGRIFELILDFDLIYQKYGLLKAYLRFLRIRFEQKVEDYNSFEIPAIIFILQDILPKFSDWKFEIGSPEQEVLYDCISLLFNILRESCESKKNELFTILQKICIFDLLHITNGKVILNIVARGNRYLELLMQSETNWVSGPVIQYLHIVQMCLSILMLLFQKKFLITTHENDMPLEVLMFTQPKEEDTLKIIRNIASYMDHIFHKQLPVLACRILRKFALKLQISLHGCFDMDSDQIRHVFVHRLRNKGESTDLKIAILDFIIACVQKQPGLTQTFFSKSSLDDKNGDESLLGLMEEFLELMSSEAKLLNDPTLKSMMSLFHELWKNQKQVIVSVMRQNDKFWDRLCNPLKFKIMPNLIKSYSQIFNIISLELYVNTNGIDPHLKKIIHDLLNPNGTEFPRWIDCIFKEIVTDKENNDFDFETYIPDWLSLLQAWKDFICVLINRYPDFFHKKAKSMFGHACLLALAEELNKMQDSRIVNVLAEMYVLMLVHSTGEILGDRKEAINILAKIVTLTQNSYRLWHRRLRICIFSILVSCITLLKDDLRKDEETAMKIFNSSCKLACEELNLLETQYVSSNELTSKDVKIDSELTSQAEESILKINLLNEALIVCRDMTDLYRCCVQMRLCLRLVQCLGSIVQIKKNRSITLAILDCVTHLVETNYADEFLSCDFSLHLWIKFLPPKELMRKDRDQFDESLWTVEDWWPLYQRILLVVSLLLRKLKSRFLEDALSFVVIHDAFLIDCITLIRQNIEINTLTMAELTVTFVYEIMKYQKQWKSYHPESYLQILKALQTCLYCSIALILRPTYIKFSVDKHKINLGDSGPSPKVIEIMNKLISIITRTCLVLLKQGPPLISLLCDHFAYMEPYSLILDLQFNTPKLDGGDDFELSFGTLMSAINHFADILMHLKAGGKFGSPFEQRAQLSPRKRLGQSLSYSTDAKAASDIVGELYPSSPSANAINSVWLQSSDRSNSLKKALEVLLTLLASQTLIFLMDQHEPRKNRQYVCREINSELSSPYSFHEYVKKLSREWSSRSFEDYSGISRRKQGSKPIINLEYHNIEPRNLNGSYVDDDVNPYTLERISFQQKLLREQILTVYSKRAEETDECQIDGDPIPILTEVTYDFPDDYLIFLSNLFISICKREDV